MTKKIVRNIKVGKSYKMAFKQMVINATSPIIDVWLIRKVN